MFSLLFFFFFQAEDGIRDYKVTGSSDVCSSDLIFADSIALTGVGASACASGSQECIGATPAFVPYPISTNTKATLIAVGSRDPAIRYSSDQRSASLVTPSTCSDV